MKTFREILGANASAQSAAVPATSSAKVGEHADITVVGLDGDRASEEDVNQHRTSAVTAVEAEQPSIAASLELIARLREHYDDQEIIRLDDLWQAAGPGGLRRRLTAL